MSIYSGLKGLLRVFSLSLPQKNGLLYFPIRNLRVEEKVKWVRPPKLRSYDRAKTGDLTSLQMPDKNSILKDFENHEKLSNCSKEVLKVFSVDNQSLLVINKQYMADMINKVKAYQYDVSSPEVMIAKKTAKIRISHNYPLKYRRKSYFKSYLNELVCNRRRRLKKLRETDYKKFEWLLEKLDIKYTPSPVVKEKVSRKKSVRQLAELQREKMKEMRIAECKQKLDELKVPFLEKKIQRLKWIMEKEAEANIKPTVVQNDIDECLKKLEEVKLEIKERQRTGYLRKIHPYTLEAYDPSRFGEN